MRYKDRTQLVREQLTEDFFQSIIAYRFCRPSGMGGPGCVIMVAENGDPINSWERNWTV